MKLWLSAVPVMLLAGSAMGHHSQAMYDLSRTVSVSGTVKEFQWTNPHCWIQVLVPGADGAVSEWSVEMGNPRQLYRSGWRPGTLKSGDKITVVLNPLRDGAKGGQFYSASDAEGKPVGGVENRP